MENNKNEVEIFSSPNEYEINQVCSILNDNNIPFIRKDYGSGSYMNIYFGQSMQNKKVFVNEDCYDKALELISTIFSNANFTEKDVQEIEELDELDENDDSNKKYRWIKYLLGLVILVLPCIILIIIIIFSIFQSY